MAGYSLDLKYEDKFTGYFEAKFFLGILKYVMKYSDDSLDKDIYIFRFKLKGKPVKNNTERDKTSEDNKKKGIGTKIKEIYQFLTDKSNERLLELAKSTILKLFNHIKPRELVGNFEFGCGDPYYTGKVLEIFTFLYATMGDRLKVIPRWDELMFKGNVKCEGKFSPLFVARTALKLWNDKDFREWRDNHNG